MTNEGFLMAAAVEVTVGQTEGIAYLEADGCETGRCCDGVLLFHVC